MVTRVAGSLVIVYEMFPMSPSSAALVLRKMVSCIVMRNVDILFLNPRDSLQLHPSRESSI